MKYPETAMRLRKAMEAKNLTPQELSNKSGVSKGSISLYLSGQNEPRTRNAGKMAEVLEVEPMWLMGFSEEIINASGTAQRLALYQKELSKMVNNMNDEQRKSLMEFAQYLESKKGGDN
jgi:repressor LexA